MTINQQFLHNNVAPCFRVKQDIERFIAVNTTNVEWEIDVTVANSPVLLWTTEEARPLWEVARLNILTFFLWIASEAMTVGAYVKTTATGKFALAVSGDNAVAKVSKEATAADQIIAFEKISTIVLP